MSNGERLEDITTHDGFRWQLYRMHNNFGPTLFFAVHPVTGERLCGGAAFTDPEECIRFMDLPR